MNLLTVHPINEDLRFLKKLIRSLKGYNKELVSTAILSNNFASHEIALSKIRRLNQNDFVLFLNHGATKGIHGCQYRARHGGHRYQFSYMEKYGYFIGQNNINVLTGKKIFCLSCNSTTLGQLAINAGAKVFIGFSTIDFDDRDALALNENPRPGVVAKTKYSLRKSVFQSIAFGVENDISFYSLVQLLRINLNKEADELILEGKRRVGFKYYKSAADCLMTIKEGVSIYGDGNMKINAQ